MTKMAEAPPPRWPRPPAPGGRHLERLSEWGRLLDNAFRVPGTRIRWGLDPLLGLVPWVGDLVSPVFAGLLIVQAVRMRVPRVIQLRMLLNALIDVGLGTLPFVGDLFDVVWQSNQMNLNLLRDHADEVRAPRRGDYLFVGFVLGLLVLAALTPILILAALLNAVGRSWW
jgi:hypothetical protein